MTDVPELETLRRDLEREVVGRKVKTAEVLIAKPVGNAAGKARFLAATEGAKVNAVHRRVRHLRLVLDNGQALDIALGRGGRLQRANPKDEVHKRTAWVLTFSQGGQLRLCDLDADSVTAVLTAEELAAEGDPPGIDPVDQPMSWTAFGHHLLQHSGKLKTVLTNDDIIAGIGPLYADEILFDAGLRHDRDVHSLNAQELRRLYRAVVEILHDAVKYRGTSLDGTGFVDLAGAPGSYQDHLQVYGKAGELSPRSRQPIAKAKFGGVWTYYCEQSQV